MSCGNRKREGKSFFSWGEFNNSPHVKTSGAHRQYDRQYDRQCVPHRLQETSLLPVFPPPYSATCWNRAVKCRSTAGAEVMRYPRNDSRIFATWIIASAT